MEKTKTVDKADTGDVSSDDFESADDSGPEEEVTDPLKPKNLESVDKVAICHVDSSEKNSSVSFGQEKSEQKSGTENIASCVDEPINESVEQTNEDEAIDKSVDQTVDSELTEQQNTTTDEAIENQNQNALLTEDVDNVNAIAESVVSNNSEAKPAAAAEAKKNDQEDNVGWGWGSWGAVLNQATASVTSGFSHVIETVETTLGIPEPGEIDNFETKEEGNVVVTTEPVSAEIGRNGDSCSDCGAEDSAHSGSSEVCHSDSYLSYWGLQSLSNAVTTKGMELVSEGIDALEVIGKKTMDVISDGDPGLRSKRNIFQKSSLSEVLQEAKEKSAKEAVERKNQDVLESVNFNDEFDRFQGIAHLEALEILSKECEAKIESTLIDMFEGDLGEVKSKLRAIENVFQKDSDPSDEDIEDKDSDLEFAVEVGNSAMALNLAFVPDKLNQAEAAVTKWLENCITEQQNEAVCRSPEEIYSHVITSLADLTAKSIEVFRKVAEMVLLAELEEEEAKVSARDRAVHLRRLTKIVTNRIAGLSASYAQCLNTTGGGGDSEDCDNITPVITEVYLESSNSTSHVQDAFKLLLPVLQASALSIIK